MRTVSEAEEAIRLNPNSSVPYALLMEAYMALNHFEEANAAFGPEASIFCPIVLAIVAIVFSLKYRDARYRPLSAPSAS